MKLLRSVLFILAVFFCSNAAFSQEYKVGETYPGFIIIKKDTTHGHIVLLNKLSSQHKVIFIGDMKYPVTTRKEYNASTISGYSVAGNYYASIPYKDKFSTAPANFALIVINGPLSLYEWYGFASYVDIKKVDDPQKPIDDKKLIREDILRKGKQPPVNTASMGFLNFKKGMGEVVREDKELVKKLEDKTYERKDLDKIVEEYNDWVESKKRR